MRLGFGLGVTMPTSTAAAVVAAVLSGINADGWTGEWASGTPPTFTPDTSPVTIAVNRQGFDASGAATTYAGARTFTRRKRNAYPAEATDTASTVAMDDYVYATDAVVGVPVNNSTEISPKPDAAWAMPHRRVVANAIDLEVVAFHRNARAGRMVAAIKFIATDGTLTVSQVVAATVASTRAGDANPTVVYACTLDVSTLAPGLVTVNAEVYPWIGNAASVLKSVDQTGLREFSPRYFLKNVTLATSPPFAYVAASGNDGTGVVSTTAATAAATPFLTIKAALDAIQTAGGGNGIDGGIIRIGSGTFVLAAWTAARVQKVGAVFIERDPAVSRANAIVTFGSAVFSSNINTGFTVPTSTGCIVFRDVFVQRTGASFLQGANPQRTEFQWDNVTFDNASVSGNFLTRSDNYWFGTTILNVAGTTFSNGANGEQRIMRGVTVDLADQQWENWITIGCRMTRAAAGNVRDFTKGAIVFCNRFINPNPTTILLSVSGATDGDIITGFWVIQNLIEVSRAGAGAMIRVSADSISYGHTDRCGIGHNTITGQGSAGRYNLFYDNNTNGTRRNHRRAWHQNDIGVQLNNKGDVNLQDGAAIGPFAYHHGVGCRGNFTQFSANAGGLSEAQIYPGARANIGTSPTVRSDPGFTNYQGVTAAGAGAGGGDYRILPGGAARGMAPVGVLSHDLAGQPRATINDTSGAYA